MSCQRWANGTIGLLGVVLVLGACSGGSFSEGPDPIPRTPDATSTSTPPEPSESTSVPSDPPTTSEEPRTPAFTTLRAMGTVSMLADGIGPRLATGPAFRRAARWVEREFLRLGYDVTRQSFPVPAGESWGVPVAAGTSTNVVARPKGFDPGSPYLLVGAHLDTVAVSPGAEDNASGVAVVLETARRAVVAPPGIQVVFVAFGGEEPRGSGDFDHHFGSLHFVAGMSRVERRRLLGMVSLDRVGVGRVVPVGSVVGSDPSVREALVRSAERQGIGTAVDLDQASSDHESFADEGMPAARLGGTSYAAYHDETDVPSVVSPRQLRQVGRVLWDWLNRAR
jgi:aminopeptidase YwaD